jgi:Prokaryotic membrane lipoprotein lipid attachment site
MGGDEMRRIVALTVLALTLAGCSSSSSLSAAATTAVPAVAVPEDAQVMCTNLDAIVITDGVAGIPNGIVADENLYKVSQAQVIAAVQADCPDLSKYMP